MDEHEVFTRLRTRFVERMRSDLIRLENEWGRPSTSTEETREAMTRLTHGLSGSGGSFGFPEISVKAAALEVALRDGGGADASWRDLLDELRRATS